MKVCIFTLGTRGDVQPYVALGKELIRAGHEAVICTGGSFREFVESHGVSFAEASLDLMALARTPEGKAVMEHPVRNFAMGVKLSKEVMQPAYRKTLNDFYTVAEGADCIVFHPKALGAVDIALSYKIPCVSMPPVPITWPVTEFPNLALTTKDLGPVLNRLSYRINAKAESSQIHCINDFRREVLHLKPRKAGVYAFCDGTNDIPVLYPVSPLLFQDVQSWKGHVCLPGFFFLEEEQTLPETLREFLEAGPKPLAVTFGSMPLADPERFLKNLRRALEITRNRAVILTGNSGIDIPCGKDAEIFTLPALSHQCLFSCVKGVLHHGGAGTMAAALRAGIPQLIMPFSMDQPFWAERLQRMGVGPKALREKDATVRQLAAAFTEMEDPEYIRKASVLAHSIRLEQGTAAAVSYLEKITADHSKSAAT